MKVALAAVAAISARSRCSTLTVTESVSVLLYTLDGWLSKRGFRMVMPNSENTRLHRKLQTLQRRSKTGDQAATGQAELLDRYLTSLAQIDSKRADDRVKVLTGAAVLELLRTGQSVNLPDQQALLDLMGQFLIRPSDREAVLGAGSGSEALHRCLGLAAPSE